LRADFYARCWEIEGLPERLSRRQDAVERLALESRREIIEKPLALAGCRAEPGLVDTALGEAGDEPGNLPLIDHALEQLWVRRESGRLTNDAYVALGRLHGALSHHAESVYGTLDEHGRLIARRFFLTLTQLAEGAEDTRRRVPKRELLGDGAERPARE